MQTDVIFCILFTFIILLLIRFYSFISLISAASGLMKFCCCRFLHMKWSSFTHPKRRTDGTAQFSFYFTTRLLWKETGEQGQKGKNRSGRTRRLTLLFFFVIFCFHSIGGRSSLQDAAVRKGPHQARTHAHQKIDVLRDVWKEDKETWRARRGTNESCGEVHVRWRYRPPRTHVSLFTAAVHQTK